MKQRNKNERSRRSMQFLAGFLSFVLFLGTLGLSAQQNPVSGIVKDANGPLSGVSVMVKGSSSETITDNAGRFTLNALPDQVLEFQYVGYVFQQVPINGRNTINVILEADIFTLEEMVVIGYGAIRKKDLTGSVQSIRGDEITLTPTNNVMAALAGKIAGMDIMKTSGAIGSDVEILLRGTRSINGSNEPLFIIDGIQGSYNQINPNDIETIDILKDAASTAIYGSAGANGVVIITTKRAQPGKAKINFDAYLGIAGNASFWHAMPINEYVDYMYEYRRTRDGVYPESIEEALGSATYENYYKTGQYVDWVGEAMKNSGRALQQTYNLSASGGSENVRVYGSLNYFNEEGMLPGENRARFGGQFNLEYDLREWVTMGIHTHGTYTLQNSQSRNIFTKSLSASPWGKAYDEYGKLNESYGDGNPTPLGNLLPNQFADERRTTYLKSSVFLDFKILKGLTYRTLLSGSSSAYRRGYYIGENATQNVDNGWTTPFTNIFNNYSYGYTFENILSYTLKKGGHDLYLTGVTSWTKSQFDGNNARGQGQALDTYLFHNMGAANAKQDARSNYTQRQQMSYAARLNYSYKGKYLISATVRSDGASHLAKGYKWDSFPAVAVGWRISDEQFMQGARTWLSDMKLRASYGITGNSGGMGAYASQTGAYTYKQVSADGTTVSHMQMGSPYGNQAIGWEKSYTVNLGLDLSLWGRANLTFDWYETDTKDLLFQRTLPITAAITGWGSPLSMWQNIGDTNNKGFEIMLETRNITNKDFQWSSTINVTHNKEKIVFLPDGDNIDKRLFTGHPVKTHYDYKYLGIWSTAEAEEAAKYNEQPGFVKVERIEKFDEEGVGDGGFHALSTTDRQILGSNSPDAIIGLSNRFRWKNWDLNIFMMTRFGQMIQSDLMGWYGAGSGVQPAGIDYWLPETNEGAYFPRPGISSTAGISSLKYVDGSFFKVKNITLAYTLPKKFLQKIGFERARFYVTGYDPIIVPFKKTLKGTDPENEGSDTFPTYKTYVFGVNFTF